MHPIIETRSATLLDMLRLLASEMLQSLDELDRVGSYYMSLAMEKKINPDEIPTGNNLARMAEAVRSAAGLCDSLDLKGAKMEAEHFISQLEGQFPPSYRNAIRRLMEVRAAVDAQLKERTVLIVDPIRSPYFNQDDLFGESVAKAFPATAEDIRRAGTCFALDEPAACMFHLMRVLECALFALAARLDVPRPATLKLYHWGKVIGKINGQISSQIDKPRNPRWANRLMQYAAIAKDYDYLLIYVQGFMQALVSLRIKGAKS